MKKIGLIALLVGILLDLVSFTEASNEGTLTAFGPKDYTQTTFEPTTATEDFSVPTIVASVMPRPNAAGWNNTDVTVSFVCSDKTSGFASCSGPVLIEQEGANQVITGTATDIAGNTASASATVNLDKTPPVVTILSADLGRNSYDPHVIFQGTANDALSGIALFTCNGTPAALSGSSFTCNVPLVQGQAILQAAATDMSGNTGLASKTETYFGYSDQEQKILAIVDVEVHSFKQCRDSPSDFTGLAWGQTPTNPFIRGVIGTKVCGDDVNRGIGGSRATIWVKYAYVDVNSDQRVLVDYGAFHWPNWNVYCPPGWEPAHGTSSGKQGALTTGTKGACDRTGLCVQYAPMNQTDTFITNVGLSYTKGDEAACPAWGEANHGYWPMQAKTYDISAGRYDIHQNCGDDEWMVLCYGRGEKDWPPMPTSIDVTDGEKVNLLETYAPRVWLAQSESYWPSSVDWAFKYLNRHKPCSWAVDVNGNPYCIKDPNYWLITKETLSSSSSVLPFFRGCDGHSTSYPCTIADAPVYAFWEKKQAKVGEKYFDFVDLVYFFYYPYNRGKELLSTVWGNHVSDWEHITVRLGWVYDDAGWSIKPVQIYYSIHDFGYIYEWDDERIPKIDTHPVVYSAWGSHGVWQTAGSHKYKSTPVGDLVDHCSEGTAWDTWHSVAAFDYNLKKGLAGWTWPLWMNDNFGDPGDCGDPSNPTCGAIYRWGNPSADQPDNDCIAGPCRLEDGPTGPVSKNLWKSTIMK